MQKNRRSRVNNHFIRITSKKSNPNQPTFNLHNQIHRKKPLQLILQLQQINTIRLQYRITIRIRVRVIPGFTIITRLYPIIRTRYRNRNLSIHIPEWRGRRIIIAG